MSPKFGRQNHTSASALYIFNCRAYALLVSPVQVQKLVTSFICLVLVNTLHQA
jgi:hypothetical protein